MQKNSYDEWKKPLVACILSSLLLYWTLISRAETPDKTLPQEDQTELKVQLFQLRQENGQLKSKNAELTDKVSRLEQELAKIEFTAALRADAATPSQVNSCLIAELKKTAALSAELSDSFEDLSLFTRDTFQILKAEPSLVKDLHSKTAAVRDRLRLLKQVEPRTQAKVGKVLSLNPSLNAAALNLGYNDGVNLGSEWLVTVREHTIATLKIIEARRNISLAAVTQGDIGAIPENAQVTRKVSSSE